MSQNRYPGVKPFERSEKDLFFGRSQDIDNVYELILLEKLVTLFGKSGYGKSSLLNAGVLPRFEAVPKESPEYFLPLIIRFGAYVPGAKMLSPLENIRHRLAEQVEPAAAMAFVNELAAGPSLWQDFKKRQSPEHPRFLLIFDQFEELFTYPTDQQQAFKNQLAELLYVAIPQAVRDAAEDLADEDYDQLVERLEIKAVFVIRSDRLSFLDQLKDVLPAIFRIRYELKPLQLEQARAAIVKPATLLGNEQFQFVSDPFVYTAAALDTILENLAGSNPEIQSGIEAFQLQIICQYIEYIVLDGRIKERNATGLIEVTEQQLPDMSNIYEEYYRQHIRRLSPDKQGAAKLVIEEGLLLINNESGEARRLSVDGGALIDRYRAQGVDEALLDELVNAFLLRRERNSTGGFNYEISHDTLIKPIAHSRLERNAEEQRLKNETKRREAEAIARQESEKRKEAERLRGEAERGRRRAVIFSYLAMALLLVASTAVYFAWRESKIAGDNLERFLRAEAREDFQIYRQLLERAKDLEGLYPTAACALYLQADSLVKEHAKAEIFSDQVAIIEEKLEGCNQ